MTESSAVTSAVPTVGIQGDARPETIITTTIYPSTTTSAILSPPPAKSSDVPIAAVAGGAVAGVVLAIVVVLVWHWWGKSLKRKEDEERREAFSFLKLRENTRRNASSVVHNYTSYRPAFVRRDRSERKVKFASNGEKQMSEKARLNTTIDFTCTNGHTGQKSALRAHPSPASPSTPPWLTRPPVARHANDGRLSRDAPSTVKEAEASGERLSIPQSLAHQSSTISSASMYSTQSGEEHQIRAPTTLIIAALGRLDPRRPLSSTYRRSARHSGTLDDLNRLSQISAGSAYLQIPEEPTDVQLSGLA